MRQLGRLYTDTTLDAAQDPFHLRWVDWDWSTADTHDLDNSRSTQDDRLLRRSHLTKNVSGE
jgi:hypothetical protein